MRKALLIGIPALLVLCAIICGILFYGATPQIWTAGKREAMGRTMDAHIHARTDDWDGLTTVTVVERAEKELFSGQTTYTVRLYVVAEGADPIPLWRLDPQQADEAAAAGTMTHACTATVQLDDKTGSILRFYTEAYL